MTLSLRNKILLAFLLALLPVLALLLLSFQDTLSRRQAVALDDQMLTAQAVAIQVDANFDAAVSVGYSVANDPLVQTMDPAILDPHLQALIALNPMYDAINVFDAQGRNRGWGHATEPAEPRLEIADREFFQQAMAQNAPTVSEVLLLRRPIEVGIVVAVPIRGAEGRPVGVVNVVLRADQLAERYREVQLLPGQTIFLVDHTGRLAFYTARPDLSYEESGVFADLEPVREALAGRPQKVADFTSPVSHDQRLAAFAPTPKHGWAVGISVPREMAFEPATTVFRELLFAFTLILLFSIALAFLLARYLAEPVRRLRAYAQALGRGDLSRRVQIRTGDELEDLGRSFNQMAEQLEERQRDVSRLRLEAEQRARQLAAVIATLGDAVVVADAEGRLLNANPAALKMLGAAEPPTYGQPLDDLRFSHSLHRLDGSPLPPEDLPLRRALAGETFSGYELTLRLNGEEQIVSCSGAPVLDESGRIVLGVAVVHDITAERRREREDEAVASIARALVHELELTRVADAIIEQSVRILNADAVSLWLADPEARRLSLLATRNLSPALIEAIRVLPLDSPLISAQAARTRQLQAVEDLPTAAPPLAGDPYQREGIRSMLAAPLISRGRLVGVVAYYTRRPRHFSPRDLEFNATVADLFAVAIENAHLYDELREAVRVRDEFMSAAAHELRTPVTTIKGWAELLARAGAHDEMERRALEVIDTQTDRITALLNDLLAVVRLRPGPPTLTKVRFDLAALARDVVARTDRTTETHQITLQAAQPLLVEADMSLIGEVLTHLLENAMRYSPGGGPIEVWAERQNGEAVVSVRDHGVGIEPERQAHVFEPFYEPVPAGVPGYLGIVSLGLHLSRQVVESHGGRLWFESTPGQGSTFHFSLPLAAPPAR